ncbi:14342_t:CDS:2, partial [Dentiscutata erythropus]
RIIIAIRSLKLEYIVWPSGNYKKEVNTGFEQIQGFLVVIGAIDESHIPLFEAPSKENKDPASVHDAKVFTNSEIFKNYKNYFKEENYLLADSAYPLLPWIMTPFKDPQGSQAQQQKTYNTAHSKTRVVVEQAFGHLKVQFPFLKEMRAKDTKKATNIIDMAIILHNFVEKHNDIWKKNNPKDDEIELEAEEDNELIDQIIENNKTNRVEREYAK